MDMAKGTSARVRLLGIGGSLRERSTSLLALKAALRYAEEAGASTVLADVRAIDLPVYRPDVPPEAYPPTLPWLLGQVRAADALILCSPTYHGTVSGAIKNVLDALDPLGADDPPYLGGKVVGLMALGGGSASQVLDALHHAVRALNGLTVPIVVAVPADALDLETGEVGDEATWRRLGLMVRQVIELARRLRVEEYD